MVVALASVEEVRTIVSPTDSAVLIKIRKTIRTLPITTEKLETECVQDTMIDTKLRIQLQLLTTIPGLPPIVTVLCLHIK